LKKIINKTKNMYPNSFYQLKKVKSILIVLGISLIFVACKSKTETNKNIVGTDSALYQNNVLADTARVEALAPGTTKRIVETRNPDGTTTTITTITSNKTSSAPKVSGVKSGTVTSTGVTTTTAKKGWSNRAKGAVIGGVGGAVVGAAVSKKKGKGAVIGGAVGAAGGYIIGNEKDKKQGR
jgi:hypothetical protein